MNDLSIASDNTQKVVVSFHPHSAASASFPDGQPVPLDGMPTIAVDSGDGTFVQDPLKPMEFEAVSGSAAAVTIYSVSGRDASGNMKSGKVTYTVAIPALDDLGLEATAAVSK